MQEITTGNKIMLRVHHEGAHLFLGDCHAIQGDGECVGMGAVEIAAELEVRVSLSPAPARLNWPRIETPTHYCTVGCARPLEDAMRIAFEELIYWMEDDWGIPATDAYLLLAPGRRSPLHPDGQSQIQLHLQDLEGHPGRLPLVGTDRCRTRPTPPNELSRYCGGASDRRWRAPRRAP